MFCSRSAAVVLVVLVVLQEPSRGQRSPGDTRKRLFRQLRRLDEQFRRLQQMTLTHLQSIAGNYNISHRADTRFQSLMQRSESFATELNSFKAVVERDLSSLKSWSRKLRRKTQRLELKLAKVERSTKENLRMVRRNLTQEAETQRGTRAVKTPQGEVHDFREKLNNLEDQMKSVHQILLSRSKQNPCSCRREQPKASKKIRMKNRLPSVPLRTTTDPFKVQTPSQTVPTATAPHPEEVEQIQSLLHPPLTQKILQHHSPKKPATICNVNSMLLFPSASTKNYVTFKTSFLTAIHELSVCTWLRVEAEYVGTLLSYATVENDNTLVLYGRRSDVLGNLDFVVGDPAYRELAMDRVLDGQWHHICVIWSSIEGQFWYYIDQQLISTGSRFQKGYDIPPGGSIILGQEQDSVAGGFDLAEAFVGRLAGFALWNRALIPGEVSRLATGKGIPRGALLTLDNVDVLHGNVQHVVCECLEYCT
ncbi:pentraxin-4 [Hoplias malabaricus]|uniref:pentraxin-4 n=1 Tax=Hoplias malabaricus TaxID=27720 RepID=UPI003462F597